VLDFGSLGKDCNLLLLSVLRYIKIFHESSAECVLHQNRARTVVHHDLGTRRRGSVGGDIGQERLCIGHSARENSQTGGKTNPQITKVSKESKNTFFGIGKLSIH
jgi:hypothetical protein